MDVPPPRPADPQAFRTSLRHAAGRPWYVQALAAIGSVTAAATLIGLLSAVIAAATWYERDYGRAAASVFIYQTWWFALIFLLLAASVFGAAAVRFPWRTRQLGFVTVHLGLLLLISGFFLSVGRLDGMLDAEPGEEAHAILLPEDRIVAIDGDRRLAARFDALHLAGYPTLGRFIVGRTWPLSRWWPLPAQGVNTLREPMPLIDDGGLRVRATRFLETGKADLGWRTATRGEPGLAQPAVRIELSARTPPSPDDAAAGGALAPRPMDDRWLTIGGTMSVGALQATFMPTTEPLLIEDLLRTSTDLAVDSPGRLLAYFAGRRHALPVPAELPATVDIAPELSIAFKRRWRNPAEVGGELTEHPDARIDPALEIAIGIGAGEARQWTTKTVWAFEPFPLASAGGPSLLYEHPAIFHASGEGQGTCVNLIDGPDRRLYLRWFSRTTGFGGATAIDRSWSGTLVGNATAMMQLAARITHLPFALPEPQPLRMLPDRKEEATRWIELEAARIGIDGRARLGRTWIARGDQARIDIGDGDQVLVSYHQARYDLKVEHGFAVRLDHFDMGTDPGTGSAASYASEVSVLPTGGGEEKARISMNQPLIRDGVRLYQTSFRPVADARGQPTGAHASVFTVATDPGLWLKYLGSAVLVNGIVLMYALRLRRPASRVAWIGGTVAATIALTLWFAR